MPKKILLTNDDGVYAVGIRAAYQSVSPLGDVTIAAPAIQQSGVGRSISIFEPLRISKTIVEGVEAYAIGGTPTDSVILGLFTILGEKPDLLVSGFNIGENISTDTVTTSGTVGAALEGASHGIPAIAASVQVMEDGLKFDDLRHHEHDFEVAIRTVRRIAKNVLREGLPDHVDVLNINFPHDVDNDTEIEFTRLSPKLFGTSVEERRDPRGRPYYWIAGDSLSSGEEGTDVHAVVQNGHISVTPLSLDSTSGIDFSELEKLV